ncbi:sugar ABC transporter substrate-binding protein [Frondihabitans sucicola]|uniref:Sugar ABC transporter substrate-binding protein n=1 Tax=Frondihabitans sucicola TaxID=1268041 RepID=A0ABM8GHW8_9MICO|nr:ABC transporter substrate-binding protein [Frondihabitans sucicola]BDZ47980.1 sugar ABC transporter substrate-binding protein [Frondihabitans sucicola]
MPDNFLSFPQTSISRRNLLRGAGGLGLLAATGGLLTACSPGGASGSGTLTFMNRWSDPTSKANAVALFAAFKKSTGVSVTNQVQPSSGSTYQPAVRNAFSSSRPPSLATDISGPEVYNLAKAGRLMDLTDFYNSKIKKVAFAGATAGAELDGKIWGLSDGATVGNTVWYNPKVLSKYSISPSDITDTDSWIAAMKEIKSGGGTPIIIGAKDQWPGGHYLNDLVQRRLGSTKATQLYNRTTVAGVPDTVKWTDDQVVKAFEDYLKFKPLFPSGFLGEAQATTDTQFLGGGVGFYEMGSWFLSTMRTTKPSFDPGVMLFPAVNGGEGKANEVTLSNDTIIASKNADREAVEKFFEYFTKPSVLVDWAGRQFTTPPYQFDADKVNVTDPLLKKLFSKVNSFSANAGPTGAALFNDQAIDTNIYTRYIWQGSVGLMSGSVSPDQLAQQLEQATVAAQAKLSK